MQKPIDFTNASKLQLLATIILSGFLLAIFWHGFLAYLDFPYPYNTFLFQPWDRFNDFIAIYDITKGLNPYAQATNYFPLAYLTFYPFTLISNTNAALLIFLSLFCCFMCWNANYYLQGLQKNLGAQEYLKCVLILCFLSYPILFCMDRANLDAIVFIFLALFLVAFTEKKYLFAALMLAIATGMKGFPIVFILLLLKQKKYFASFLCVVLTLLLSLLALASFRSGIIGSLHPFQHWAVNFGQNYIIQDGGMTSSISLFSLLKVIIKYFYLAPDGHLLDGNYRTAILTILPYYIGFSVLMLAIVALYIALVDLILWKQVMLLSICITLLPAISGDYRLIFLYLPLLLFIIARDHDQLAYTYTILFGLVFIPKNFFVLPHTVVRSFECVINGQCGTIPVGAYSVMSLLNIVLLAIFGGLIMVNGLRARSLSLMHAIDHAANPRVLQSPPTGAPDYP